MATLEQERAKYAWGKVIENSKNKDKSKAFKSLAKGAPALIMSNGLMPSLAFWWSKNEEKQPEDKELVRIILCWLQERNILKSSDFKEAMDELQNSEMSVFRNATEETLEILKWLRNFASAVC